MFDFSLGGFLIDGAGGGGGRCAELKTGASVYQTKVYEMFGVDTEETKWIWGTNHIIILYTVITWTDYQIITVITCKKSPMLHDNYSKT